MPPVEPPRRHASGATQTDDSEFLDLRTLQMASAGQQDDIVALRRDLQQAIANSASAMHMSAAVARQKGHLYPVQRAGQDRIGWRAPRAFHGKPFGPLQPVDVIDAGAADHGNFRLCHEVALGLSCGQSIKLGP